MNKKKVLFLILSIFLILCALSSACTYFLYRFIRDRVDDGEEKLPKLSDSLDTFTSENEFDEYVSDLVNKYKLDELLNVPSVDEEMTESPEASDGLGGTDESITNVQETGVDEGDIVKAWKDYLIILRRGRLFSVLLKNGEVDVVTPVDMINAYPKGYTLGTWYDEMLIYKNRVVVIGYSYQISATEIHIFSISDEGKFSHENTYVLDSNDYYSSRNYASRLVDSNLIFYMPYYLFTYDYSGPLAKRELSFPKVREWIKGNELSEGADILSKTDIYKPVQDSDIPTLHVVVKCDLEGSFSCSAKAVLGPYSRTFYVSTNNIYVWVSDPYSYYYEEDEQDNNAYLYMLTIEDQSARVIKAQGGPIDQFSFKEDGAGFLNVLLADNTGGDAMWNPEHNNGQLALLRVSLGEFDREAKTISKDHYTLLTTPDGYSLQNRFVGDFLLYGSGSSWIGGEVDEDKSVYILNYIQGRKELEIPLGHAVERIEVMGDNAVVVGSKGDDLAFSSIGLVLDIERKDTYILKGAVQGETRSHGYFFKQFDEETGIIGLPVRDYGSAYYSLYEGSAYIQFLKVDSTQMFSNLGKLTSGTDVVIDDSCEASCVDWYGNARPIFYSGRIFALLGYELVEGTYQGNKIVETGREDFFSDVRS